MTNQDDFDEEYYAELYQTQLAYKEFFEIELYNKPIYSRFDIDEAILYACKNITLEPTEIGKNVYDGLFNEKILEYLNGINK